MQIAKHIVKAVFTYGNVLDAGAVFLKILRHPEMRELSLIGDKGSQSQQSLFHLIIDNLNKYLTTIMEAKGSRRTVDQRAYRTVMAACSGTNLKRDRHIAHASNLLVIIIYSYLISIAYIYDNICFNLMYVPFTGSASTKRPPRCARSN